MRLVASRNSVNWWALDAELHEVPLCLGDQQNYGEALTRNDGENEYSDLCYRIHGA